MGGEGRGWVAGAFSQSQERALQDSPSPSLCRKETGLRGGDRLGSVGGGQGGGSLCWTGLVEPISPSGEGAGVNSAL